MTSKIIRIVAFFLILTILPIITLILPKKEISQNENRVLQQMPNLDFQTYTDKSFMADFEKFFADHFVGREKWVNFKSNIELASGKKEINSVYICENQLIEKLAKPVDKNIEANIKKIKEFASVYKVKPYFMLVPTASEIQSAKLPPNAINYNQSTYINEIYKSLSDVSVNLDAYSALKAVANDDIYYKTDHHWTSKGAYYAYYGTAKSMGIVPESIDKFNIEHAAHDFKGTLFSKTLYDKTDADVIDIYSLSTVQNNFAIYDEKNQVINNELYFRKHLNEKDKYLTYLGENRGYMKIVKNNAKDKLSSKKLLVFKDSYANSIIPFYANHFDEIVVIDLRFFNKELDELVDVHKFDKTMFLYNMDSFATQNQLKNLII